MIQRGDRGNCQRAVNLCRTTKMLHLFDTHQIIQNVNKQPMRWILNGMELLLWFTLHASLSSKIEALFTFNSYSLHHWATGLNYLHRHILQETEVKTFIHSVYFCKWTSLSLMLADDDDVSLLSIIFNKMRSWWGFESCRGKREWRRCMQNAIKINRMETFADIENFFFAWFCVALLFICFIPSKEREEFRQLKFAKCVEPL